MSDKRASSEKSTPCKRQKINEHEAAFEVEEEEGNCCIVCMRTEAELLAADCPMRDEHGCPRCTKTSWCVANCDATFSSLMSSLISGATCCKLLHENVFINLLFIVNSSFVLFRSICEECEEHHLSRKCPLCRGEYAPMMLYTFPDLEPNPDSDPRYALHNSHFFPFLPPSPPLLHHLLLLNMLPLLTIPFHNFLFFLQIHDMLTLHVYCNCRML